jgi:hypothetical protein
MIVMIGIIVHQLNRVDHISIINSAIRDVYDNNINSILMKVAVENNRDDIIKKMKGNNKYLSQLKRLKS